MADADWSTPNNFDRSLSEPLGKLVDEGCAIIEGFPHKTQRTITPLIIQSRQTIKGTGTAFSFGIPGLWATAQHVVSELSEHIQASDGRNLHRQGEIDGRKIRAGCVYAAESEGESEDHLGGPLWAKYITQRDAFDVAALWTPLPRSDAGESLSIPVLVLDVSTPNVGDEVLAIGYPKQDWGEAAGTPGKPRYEVDQSYQMSHGRVEAVEYYHNANSRSMNRGPKLRCSAEFKPGMSGGPVINLKTGGVCGIVSSGMSGNQFHKGYSTATLSWTLLTHNMPFKEGQLPIGVTALRSGWQGIVGEWKIKRDMVNGRKGWQLQTQSLTLNWEEPRECPV